jgi:hypothetical protein
VYRPHSLTTNSRALIAWEYFDCLTIIKRLLHDCIRSLW